MKLSFSKIEPFLKKPPQEVRVFLLFGPDAGLVHERAEKLADLFVEDRRDPFSVRTFSGSSLGNDTAQLLDEMAAIPFTGGKKLVRVYQAIESNAKPIEALLKDSADNNSVLVIEAGALQARSKLRSLCERKTPIAVAVPCYLENAIGRQKTISAFLEQEKLSASRDVIQLLAQSLPPDRMAMRCEMEKLALYVQGKEKVTLEDVRAIISQAGGAEIEDLVQAVANGGVARAVALLDFLKAEQTAPVTLFRAMQRHFTQLHIARSFMEQGASAGEAIKKLSPPVFWKNVDPMTRQLRRWSLPRLEKRLAELLEAEAAVKRTGTPDAALCAQLFLNMAAKA
ncbi:MAG TPA: DNA polymerase III subunit delta [Rhodospirillaceae bacterium]|nr:DNA polymerase III subunit delta [Rhodospirillaceae bacterium]